MGEVTESLSVIAAGKAAGKVIINTLLHRVDLLPVWLSQHISIHLNLQKTLEAVCLFSLLKREDRISHTYNCKYADDMAHVSLLKEGESL